MTRVETAPEATWHRLSPRMLLIHPIVEVGRALPALLGVFLAGTSQGHNYWGLVAAGVVAALSLTRWFTTRLRITPDSVQLQHGLLRRRTIATHRDRIRTVDVTAHVLHRILGLAKVVVGTGISDRKGEGRIILDGLTVAGAEALRDELLHRAPQPVTVQQARAELVRLDRSWIRFGPFTMSGVVTGLVIYGFAWRIQGESGVDVWRSGPLASVTRTLDRMPLAGAIALVALSVLVFVAITSTVGYVLAFWNFRLVRHESGTLQVTRGLLTTRATSIERRRLVGMQLNEALVLRAVRGARVLAVATGLRAGRGAEIGGEVLLPPAPRRIAERVASEVLDGTDAPTAPLLQHGPAARRRRLTRALAFAGLVAAGCLAGWSAGGPLVLLAIAAAVLVLSVPLARDRYASLGHALVDGYVVTRSGSILRKRTALAGAAVIGWNLRTTLFQRRAGVTTLTATTAAGRQGYSVRDLDPAEALALATTITPELVHQFRA